MESDKSSVEVPSTHEGVIEKINVKVGDKVNKGDLILSLNAESDTEAKKKVVSDQKEIENKEIKKSFHRNQKKLFLLCLHHNQVVSQLAQKSENLQESWAPM